jgi:molecular chaperone HscB
VDFKQNYFELFGLPEAFELDLKLLSARYQELQKTFHPDRFASASERERRISLQQAAQVNAAFQTLKDPLARARYLLELRGAVTNDEATTIRDPEFLEQQMGLREELAEIKLGDDPMAALMRFMKQLDQRVKDCVEQLKQDFARGDEAALLRAQTAVHQLQFLYRLRQEAEALEEALI